MCEMRATWNRDNALTQPCDILMGLGNEKTGSPAGATRCMRPAPWKLDVRCDVNPHKNWIGYSCDWCSDFINQGNSYWQRRMNIGSKCGFCDGANPQYTMTAYSE